MIDEKKDCIKCIGITAEIITEHELKCQKRKGKGGEKEKRTGEKRGLVPGLSQISYHLALKFSTCRASGWRSGNIRLGVVARTLFSINISINTGASDEKIRRALQKNKTKLSSRLSIGESRVNQTTPVPRVPLFTISAWHSLKRKHIDSC
ncbi:hypothetical protein AVEN_115600-1 [Araneus ventricosus]|uniref:Uncharacterized protein n=1 Tax=Araneus ventricosus TaxID=182803 RepID=A0A4Y2N120_ARAVE|nr:hypothetical protein AVEN_115600-1 [Araneus ventricosus]